MTTSRILAFLLKELREIAGATVFFAVGFNLILLTTQLILADYREQFGSFMAAIVLALIVGKSVLVANTLRLMRRFDSAPKIQPVMFKTFVYWTAVFVVRFFEKLGEYFFAGGTLSGIPEYVSTHFTWHRFAAIQIWIFVLFLVYTSIVELNAHLGKGELMKIFFTWHSPGMQQMGPAAGLGVHTVRPANGEIRPH
jgi:hypothetical protein